MHDYAFFCEGQNDPLCAELEDAGLGDDEDGPLNGEAWPDGEEEDSRGTGDWSHSALTGEPESRINVRSRGLALKQNKSASSEMQICLC